MADSSRLEENCVVEILVGGVPVADAFACVEEIRNGEVLGGELGLEPHQDGGE